MKQVRTIKDMTATSEQFARVAKVLKFISSEGIITEPTAKHLTVCPMDNTTVLPLTVLNLNTCDFCAFYFPNDKLTSIGRQLRRYKESIGTHGPQD